MTAGTTGTNERGLRVGIVGGGVAGLAALWALNGNSPHHVEIFESADYLGGHANSIWFEQPGKEGCWVDTAFLMINKPGWPNFTRFLEFAKIPLHVSCGSYSLSRGSFAWSSNSLTSLFAGAWGLFDPRPWRMFYDIVRFNTTALDVLRSPETGCPDDEETVGVYLLRNGYSVGFREDYLIPLAATVWSMPPHRIAMSLPIRTLVSGFYSLDMLKLFDRAPWLTIQGGSREYIRWIASRAPKGTIFFNTRIVAVNESTQGASIVLRDGTEHHFDHVILATHSNISYKLLKAGNALHDDDKSILSACDWSALEVIMHWDEALMPANRNVWSAWNNIIPPIGKRAFSPRSGHVTTTFDMNLLHTLPVDRHGRMFGSINPSTQPDPAKVICRIPYTQPVLLCSPQTVQRQLVKRSTKNRKISFAGAWTCLGTHEDGWLSGLLAAEALGAKLPYERLSREKEACALSFPEIVCRLAVGELAWIWFIWNFIIAQLMRWCNVEWC